MAHIDTEQAREETIREYFRRVDANDPHLFDLLTDDVEVFFPKFGTHQGKPAMQDLARRLSADLTAMRHDLGRLRFLHSGHHVVVEGYESGVAADGQEWPDGRVSAGRFCNVFRFDGDRISSVHIYADPDYSSTHLEKVAQLYPGS